MLRLACPKRSWCAPKAHHTEAIHKPPHNHAFAPMDKPLQVALPPKQSTNRRTITLSPQRTTYAGAAGTGAATGAGTGAGTGAATAAGTAATVCLKTFRTHKKGTLFQGCLPYARRELTNRPAYLLRKKPKIFPATQRNTLAGGCKPDKSPALSGFLPDSRN